MKSFSMGCTSVETCEFIGSTMWEPLRRRSLEHEGTGAYLLLVGLALVAPTR